MQAPKILELGPSNMDHLWVLGPEMNSTIPSNTTLLHTLIKSAKTVALMIIQHSLTKTTMTATTMKTTKNSVVASTPTLSLLQIYAAHAMEAILYLREKLELTVLNGTNPPLHMLQTVNKDLSVPIQSNT